MLDIVPGPSWLYFCHRTPSWTNARRRKWLFQNYSVKLSREREVVVGRRARTKHRSKRGPRSAVRDQEKRNDTTRVRFMGNAWREMQRIVQVSRKLLLCFYAFEKEINRLEKLPSTRSRLITWNLLNQSAGQYSILLVFLFSSKQMRWKLYSCWFLYLPLVRMIETKVW